MAAKTLMQSCSRLLRNQHRQSLALARCKSTASSLNPEDEQSSVPSRLDPVEADNLMDIGIRRIFSEDHDIFRQNVRRFMQEEVAPNIDRWEQNGQVDREVWQKAGEQGFIGASVPAEAGGIGGEWLHSVILMEEQSYVNDSGLGFVMHSDIVMPYICRYGTPQQIEKFIPASVEGKVIGALAMTEPGAGSDLQGIRTNAVKKGDDWILNGSKTFITNGLMSDVVIVVAVTNPEAKSAAHGITLFLVEEGMPGFKKGKKLQKIGQKAQDTSELFFDDVRLTDEHILGEVNKGFYYLMNELPQERLCIADLGLASAEFMFETTRTYVKERKAFGKTISNLQTVQHKLAEMKTEICVTRDFIDRCNEQHNMGKLGAEGATMAKYWATELQNRIATQCLQLHGGWGYMWEYPIAKAFANARVQTIYGGSNEIMKELIARNIVKK